MRVGFRGLLACRPFWHLLQLRQINNGCHTRTHTQTGSNGTSRGESFDKSISPIHWNLSGTRCTQTVSWKSFVLQRLMVFCRKWVSFLPSTCFGHLPSRVLSGNVGLMKEKRCDSLLLSCSSGVDVHKSGIANVNQGRSSWSQVTPKQPSLEWSALLVAALCCTVCLNV